MRALLVAGWLAAGCGPRGAATGPAPGDAILYVTSNVRDAQVYVDGRFVAPLDALGGGLAVDPGLHRVELRREDYFSSYREVRVVAAERKTVAMEMSAILP